MNLSLSAKVIWAAGFVLNAALLFVLLYKRRYRTVPWFTTWIGLGCCNTIVLFLAYRFGSHHSYTVLYWSWAFLDLILQVGVVWEIARSIFRRSGKWVEGARVRLISVAAIGPLVAFALAWFMTPAAESKLDEFAARGNLFMTVLICLLFSTVVVASQQLGVGWRNHIMRESYGLVLWTIVNFVTDTLHAYWRTMGNFSALEYMRILVFQASLIYWSWAFWMPEPSPILMPVEVKNDLDELAARLDYAQSHRASSTGGTPQ